MTSRTWPDKLRVVFTGYAGTSKGQVIRRFAAHIRRALEADGVMKSVEFADAEELIKPLGSFLPLARLAQQSAWMNSVGSAVKQCLSADYSFLSLHLSYRWYNRFDSPLSWRPGVYDRESFTTAPKEMFFELIGKEFQPDYFVCLIDDIQAAQRRVESGDAKIHLRLGEYLTWRNVETFLTDLLAQETILRRDPRMDQLKFPFEHSPVVSSRHPLSMLERYLFEP